MNNSKMVIMMAVLGCSSMALAQTSAKEGLDKLKLNIENSKSNTSDYKKNLEIVDQNINEITKAKGSVEEQRKQVQVQVDENNKRIKKTEDQEKEITKLITEEKKNQALEEQKIKDLEQALAKLKDNQIKRQQNLADYQAQLNLNSEDKKSWQARGGQLKEQMDQVSSKTKQVLSMDNEWKGKKKGYEAEISRWEKETEKHQKIYDQYSSIAGK